MKKLWKRNQIMITALALMIAIAGYLNFMGKKVDEETLFTTSAQFEEANADVESVQGENVQAESESVADGGELAQITDVTEENDLAMITNEAGETEEAAGLTDIDSMDSEEEMAYSDYLDEEQADILETNAEAVNPEEILPQAETGEEPLEGMSAAVTEDYDGETPGEAVFTNATAVSSLAGANLLKEQTRAKNKESLMEIINSDNLPDSAKQEAVDSMIALTDIAQKECSAEILLEAKGFTDVVVSISGEIADVIVAASELTDAQRAQIEDIVKRKTGIEASNIIISPVAEK